MKRLVRWSGISDKENDLCYQGQTGWWDVTFSQPTGQWKVSTPFNRHLAGAYRPRFSRRVDAQREAERLMIEHGEIDLITRIGKL